MNQKSSLIQILKSVQRALTSDNGQLLPMLERKLTVATQASLATMNCWVASVHLRLT
jgi:hypothetical protein